MYAIIKHDGRQYRVEERRTHVDCRDASVGDQVTLGDVLAAGSAGDLKFGTPLLSGARI